MMLTKLKSIYANFGFNFPLLIAFLLPFGINYGLFIIAWSVCFLTLGNPQADFKAAFKNKWTYVFIGFFLVHAIGYFFSLNKLEALNSIEIKIGFVAFPILLFSSNFTETHIKKIVISFVSGCLLATAICLFRACYLYFFENVNSFFYSEFACFMHPSYFAMYLVFAQLIVMLFYPKWLVHLSHLKAKIVFISLMNVVAIFLCSSKMGLISAFLLLPITQCIILYTNGFKKTIAALLLGFVIIVSVAYKLFPTPFQRIQVAFKVTSSAQKIDKTDAESTAVRILIWEESIKLIKQQTLFGTTAGDANDQLIQAYEREGLTGALIKKLNAHNQFLQTFIGTGIIGFCLLLVMTIGALIYGFVKRNYILLLFSILIIFNFLVESMLQAQAGFIFFTFFFCILVQYNLSKMSSHNS